MITKNLIFVTFAHTTRRFMHVSVVSRVREITVKKENDTTTVIEGRYIPSPRKPFLLNINRENNKCFLCQLKLDIKHTDVLILSQFINSKGEMLNIDDIGICKDQYTLIENLVYMAQYAGLLPKPPRERPWAPYEKLNTYYDEKTIDLRPKEIIKTNKLRKLKLGPIEKLRVKPEKGLAGEVIGLIKDPKRHFTEMYV